MLALALVALHAAAAVAAEEEEAEAEAESVLLARLLSGPMALAALHAAESTGEAAALRRPTLPNPTLEARHEEARGPAGASTDLLGGAVTLDLGLAGTAEARAASLRRQAAAQGRHAAVLEEVCGLRGELLGRWVALEEVAIAESTQGRLERIAAGLDELAARGEVAPYDRDRARLDALAHAPALATARRALAERQAVLDAHLGGAGVAPQVTLAALGPLPDRAALLEQALAGQPALRALRLEEQAAQATEAAARRAALPDLEIAGGVRWDAPPTGGASAQGFEVGGALEVPLFDRGQVAIRSAGADQAALAAQRLRAEAEVRAQIEGAWSQASSTATPPPRTDAAALWQGAERRYTAGEGSIDELLQVASAIAAAQRAEVQWAHLHRRARLDLSCAAGRFDEPEIQSVLEDALQ